MGKNKAVFLDRDGTVSEEIGYIHDKDLPRYALVPGAAAGMQRLAQAGYKLVLVTNQSGVARGYYPESMVQKVHVRLQELLAQAGGPALDAVYYCPHHPDPKGPADTGEIDTPGRVEADPSTLAANDCDCRKPKSGMGLRAARDLDLDLGASWMVGDKNADLGFAENLGVQPILVLTGYGKKTLEGLEKKGRKPGRVADDLAGAAAIILDGR
ncbi:MAG: HAD family hydrolase [candidate division FCPU426 bacterium]